MTRRASVWPVAAVFVAAPLLALARIAAARPPEAPKRVTCSFSNPAYSGYCRETADVPKNGTGNAVCADILACLNDNACIKTYCQATTVRGGWKLESVKEEEGK
ncbi:MAG TPA: hypothetical protein VIA45_05565 [Thermoanaerobaculia bacterium]|jgi:hypothetical protein